MHNTKKSQLVLLGLHLLPGFIFTIILFTVIPRIQNLGLDLFFTQILFVTVFLLGLELYIANRYCQSIEGRSLWSALKAAGSVSINWKALGFAIVWAGASVIIMRGYLSLAMPIIEQFHEISLIKLPAWHFQNLEMPAYPGFLKTLLISFMLATNVFCEEVYFRGFLLERLKFLGKAAFVVNGLLFIAYHIFQIPIAYPLIPFGLLLSGYYVIFRNVWGAMLIHLILNLAL